MLAESGVARVAQGLSNHPCPIAIACACFLGDNAPLLRVRWRGAVSVEAHPALASQALEVTLVEPGTGRWIIVVHRHVPCVSAVST